MFKSQRQFNIITGQYSNRYLNQRTRSCASQLQSFKKVTPFNCKIKRLGNAKDKKQFQYSYMDGSMPLINQKQSNQQHYQTVKRAQSNLKSKNPIEHTMMNYVSTGYNILNHTNQIETAKVASKQTFKQYMPEAHKKSPLTQHLHRARLLAPNYHDNYQQRFLKHQFNKKPGFCASICDIQKTYGTSKYFRKLK